jgi:hypothetical protein
VLPNLNIAYNDSMLHAETRQEWSLVALSPCDTSPSCVALGVARHYRHRAIGLRSRNLFIATGGAVWVQGVEKADSLVCSRRSDAGELLFSSPSWANADEESSPNANAGCDCHSLLAPMQVVLQHSTWKTSQDLFMNQLELCVQLAEDAVAKGRRTDASARQRNLSRHQKFFLQKRLSHKGYPLYGRTIFGQVFVRGGMIKFSKWKVPPTGGPSAP